MLVISFRYNNLRSQALRVSPNEVAYGFTLNDSLDLIGPEKHILPKDTVRIDASNAIAFT